ncbi:flavin reductase [Gluconobacter roseus]|uniref:flavin reductase n=1 Tax=Gluconobacter roseus TaxID=586239 RepID=UPI0038D0F7BB
MLNTPTPDTPAAQTVTTTAFRDAMAHLAAAVTIITTDGPHGRFGMTASAVTSVTDTPPTLLVCINRSTRSHDAFHAHGRVVINILSGEQQDIAGHFASRHKSMEERFAAAPWEPDAHGQPVLHNSLVSLSCQIDQSQDVGTHSVLFCRIEAITQAPAPTSGLLWFDRSFATLPLIS